MIYEILITKNALQDIKKLDRKITTRVSDAIDELSREPLGSHVVRLKGYSSFRKRVGNYRIIFRVDPRNAQVIIEAVLPRGNAYKNL